MILVHSYCFNVHIRKKFPAFFRDEYFEVGIDSSAQNFSSVSRDPHDMILGLVYRVGFFHELHSSMIAR